MDCELDEENHLVRSGINGDNGDNGE